MHSSFPFLFVSNGWPNRESVWRKSAAFLKSEPQMKKNNQIYIPHYGIK